MSKRIQIEDDDIIIHISESENAYRSWIRILHYLECLCLEGAIEQPTFDKMSEMMISLKEDCRL